MARKLRLEFPGAVYHVTARANERKLLYRDDVDRQVFLGLLSREVFQQGWRLHAFCLMDNHYHLLLETPEPNLARGMRRLNSVYSQGFNRRHRRVGHLFQGRYHAVFVQKEAYLLELSRYIVLNPVRARMVAEPDEWLWSSYRATAGIDPVPPFLQIHWLLEHFNQDFDRASREYRQFVNHQNVRSPWEDIRGQVWLGSESFRLRLKEIFEGRVLDEIPKTQREPLRPTEEQVVGRVLAAFEITEDELWTRNDQDAFQTAVYLLRRIANVPLRKVARLAGVSACRISSIQRRIEDGHPPERLGELLGPDRFRVSEGADGERYKVKIRPYSYSMVCSGDEWGGFASYHCEDFSRVYRPCGPGGESAAG